jgi:hypothetical protein
VQCVAACCESRGYELFVIFIPVRLGLFVSVCDVEIIIIIREEVYVSKMARLFDQLIKNFFPFTTA